MSDDLDRLLTDAAATPTRPVDADALHARAQRARRRDHLLVSLCAVGLLIAGTAAVLAATSHNQSVEFGPADAPNGQDATGPPVTATDPLHLVLSHHQVASSGQTITLAVVNGSNSDFSYGASGVLERWDGAEWERVGGVALSPTWWESGGSVARPDSPIAVPDIGYAALSGGAGGPEWLTLPVLQPGWYQLVRPGSGSVPAVDGPPQASAVFQVVAADEPLQPVLAVPWENPYLSLDIAAISPTGGPLDMVPAEGTEVAGRSDADNGEGSAQLSRWEQDAWSSPQTATVQLHPEEPVGNIFAVRVDIPPLEPGFWRVQIQAADGGQLTGYLWVLDTLADPSPSASETGTALDMLQAARDDWAALDLQDYLFTFHRRCLCPPEATGPFEVTVTEGQIALIDGQPVDAVQDLVLTVPQLHDRIEQDLNRGALVTGGYDRHGLPTNLYVDPTPPRDLGNGTEQTTTVDDEMTYTAILLTEPR
ncbi:hypothetical protein BH23ACT9_BH23ACT9_25620 [soil metagenome]